MSLTNELGMLEAERDRIKAENETLKIRMAKQAGALEESRAQNRQLILRLEKVTQHNTTLREHFRVFHGNAEHIAQQQKELIGAEQAAHPTPTVPDINPPLDTVETMARRLKRLVQPAHNGAIHGQA